MHHSLLPKPPAARSALRHQHGVSLVELMVGILIGMLVVAVALLTLSSTRSSSLLVDEATQLNQQVNMTMDVIGQQIKQAGAMNLFTPPGGNQVEFENFAALNGSEMGTRKVVVRGQDGTGSAPDTLTVTYSAPSGGGMSQNCSGTNPVSYPIAAASAAATSQQVVSTIAVTSRSLTCGIAGVSGSAQPLATNVEDFQVRYLTNNGIDSRSRTATDVGADWTGIDGVEICLHITGESSRVAPQAPPFVDCSGNDIAADGRLHRVARSTFRLRNSAAL